ncbi:MAG TPA: hypothetical protein VG734_27240, partial [Lacunisphaera sp.]|nr:hypothetical protein [Lacunisphaera sp.]
ERPLEFTMRFESFADYWDPFLAGQGPAGAYLRSAGGDRREALRREVKRRLALRSENEPFSVGARAWAARGVRREDTAPSRVCVKTCNRG